MFAEWDIPHIGFKSLKSRKSDRPKASQCSPQAEGDSPFAKFTPHSKNKSFQSLTPSQPKSTGQSPKVEGGSLLAQCLSLLKPGLLQSKGSKQAKACKQQQKAKGDSWFAKCIPYVKFNPFKSEKSHDVVKALEQPSGSGSGSGTDVLFAKCVPHTQSTLSQSAASNHPETFAQSSGSGADSLFVKCVPHAKSEFPQFAAPGLLKASKRPPKTGDDVLALRQYMDVIESELLKSASSGWVEELKRVLKIEDDSVLMQYVHLAKTSISQSASSDWVEELKRVLKIEDDSTLVQCIDIIESNLFPLDASDWVEEFKESSNGHIDLLNASHPKFIESLIEYSCTGYEGMNRFMRTLDPRHPEHKTFDHASSEAQWIGENIALAGQVIGMMKPLKQPLEVVRGAKVNRLLGRGETEADLKGLTIQELGFLSTSLAERPPKCFLQPDSVIQHFNVPKGTRALWMGKASSFGEREKEVLFPPGTRYYITRVEEEIETEGEISRERVHIYADIVPSAYRHDRE